MELLSMSWRHRAYALGAMSTAVECMKASAKMRRRAFQWGIVLREIIVALPGFREHDSREACATLESYWKATARPAWFMMKCRRPCRKL